MKQPTAPGIGDKIFRQRRNQLLQVILAKTLAFVVDCLFQGGNLRGASYQASILVKIVQVGERVAVELFDGDQHLVAEA